MKEVRSFSLDSVVAAAVDDIPRNERSRKINQILRKSLLEEKIEEVSIGQIRKLIQSMMQDDPAERTDRNDNEQARNALSGIIGMRKGGI